MATQYDPPNPPSEDDVFVPTDMFTPASDLPDMGDVIGTITFNGDGTVEITDGQVEVSIDIESGTMHA
jgi:hypothetical protein